MIPIGMVVCLLGCAAIHADTEEPKNLLMDGGFESPVEIIRENPEKGHIVTRGWMLLRGRSDGDRRWEVTTETAAEGKKSFKMTNTTGRGSMHLRMMPEKPVSEFQSPYRVSCRIRTQGRKDPVKIPVLFCIRGRAMGTGGNAKFLIAEIKDNTDWTEYSAVVNREDVPFKAQTDLWFVSVLVTGFQGTVWVDDVRVVPVDAPALRVRLNFTECFLRQKEVIVQGQVNPKLVDLRKEPLEIELLDSQSKVIRIKRGIINSRHFMVPLDITGLPEGQYTVKIRIADTNGKIITRKRTFRKTQGPFPPVEPKTLNQN